MPPIDISATIIPTAPIQIEIPDLSSMEHGKSCRATTGAVVWYPKIDRATALIVGLLRDGWTIDRPLHDVGVTYTLTPPPTALEPVLRAG